MCQSCCIIVGTCFHLSLADFIVIDSDSSGGEEEAEIIDLCDEGMEEEQDDLEQIVVEEGEKEKAEKEEEEDEDEVRDEVDEAGSEEEEAEKEEEEEAEEEEEDKENSLLSTPYFPLSSTSRTVFFTAQSTLSVREKHLDTSDTIRQKLFQTPGYIHMTLHLSKCCVVVSVIISLHSTLAVVLVCMCPVHACVCVRAYMHAYMRACVCVYLCAYMASQL